MPLDYRRTSNNAEDSQYNSKPLPLSLVGPVGYRRNDEMKEGRRFIMNR